MSRTRLADPQPAVSDRLQARLAARLAERGINPAAPVLADTPEPIPALEAAQRRIPYAYRDAFASHPAVIAWARTIAASATAPNADAQNPHWGSGGRRVIARGPSLLLWGNTGAGKTHEAFGAIRSLTAAGCAVPWHAVKATDLFGQMRQRTGVDVEWLLRSIVRVPLLLLDDLGTAKPSEWNEDITFRLLAWRDEHHLPTLVTTNLPPVRTEHMDQYQPVLRDKVGDRVLSRLSGMCTGVEFNGPDRRFLRD
ncbi:ATP-binding protein [Streptomyces venezuelae]|uniref:ATP-binding protein n=1 Tax=Streptomyces sp. B6(2022) TaxID=3404749 RepID=UPI00311F40B3